jgi:hypothetical protein
MKNLNQDIEEEWSITNARKILGESGKTLSNADRRIMQKLFGESGNTT